MPRPQKISDDAILAVEKDLRRTRDLVTGVQLRRELKQQYGIRAGTDRVYRLLRRTSEPESASGPAGADSSTLTHERDAALKRAQLAELREEATQKRTAVEIDTLRQALRKLGIDPFTMEPLGSKPFRV